MEKGAAKRCVWDKVPKSRFGGGLTNERSLGRCGGKLVGEFFNILIS